MVNVPLHHTHTSHKAGGGAVNQGETTSRQAALLDVLVQQRETGQQQRRANEALERRLQELQERIEAINKGAGRHIRFLLDRIDELETRVKQLEACVKERTTP
jgi:polyhydroxyalkanoate synthesis regulator phasin